jgi:hypothetical protein
VPNFGAAEQRARAEAVANNLRIDAATAEVLRGLAAAGVKGLLLKGPALSDWYAPEEARSYLDCDLWVGPGDVQTAGDVLAGLGFRRDRDDRGLPEWWQEHATTWSRGADGVTVDVHRHLQGLGVDDATAWHILSERTETVVVAGHPAPTLPAPARALYVTLHAAHHGRAWGKALSHVERAVSTLDESVWRDARDLAGRLGALDAFAAGLRLTADGAELADRMRLPTARSVKVELHASTPPPVALGFDQLARAGGARAGAVIIARKFVPPPGFIRHWWPPAARSRWMLALGYAYRPLWVLRRSPAGFRAWRSARRSVRARR